MWGITGRSLRTNAGSRSHRSLNIGLARISARGPVEHAVLEISGELDFSDAELVYEHALELPHKIVSIDLAGLEFIDSAGACVIDRLRADIERKTGEKPALIGSTRAVDRTLRLVRRRSNHLALN